MTMWGLFTSTWQVEPTVIAGCGALFTAYTVAVLSTSRRHGAAPVNPPRAAVFLLGVLILLLALISPLDTLGDGYLFSAHMVQHLLLVLVVPPLLLLGVPPALGERLLSWPLAARMERALGQPLVAWTLGVGTLWAWHAPALYNAALQNEGVHVVQHLLFLVTSTIFWWPVIVPTAHRRLLPLAALLYLFTAGGANSVLGIILTFTPPGLYPFYLRPADPLGILPLLRDQWGLSPAADQQVGGVLMWIAGSPIYLCAVLVTLARWFGEPDDDLRRNLHAA